MKSQNISPTWKSTSQMQTNTGRQKRTTNPANAPRTPTTQRRHQERSALRQRDCVSSISMPKFGFDWGSAQVTRTASLDNGTVVITIETPKRWLHIRITKTGIIRTTEYKKER